MHDIRGLYAITDPGLTPGESLFDAVDAALRGGTRLLQYRDKMASPPLRKARALRLCALCQRYGAALIINDEPRLAAEIGAQGVHLGQADCNLSIARRLLGKDAIIGVSCHGNLALARAAGEQGASYIALGRFFPSHTKPEAPPASLDILQKATGSLRTPVVAIGGITPDNAPQLIEAGAKALAVVHGLFAAPDIEIRARQFTSLFPA